MSKALLLVAVLLMIIGGAFNLGLFPAHDIDALYALLPTGASFFGLYLIGKVLGRETERYDHDQRKGHAAPAKISVG